MSGYALLDICSLWNLEDFEGLNEEEILEWVSVLDYVPMSKSSSYFSVIIDLELFVAACFAELLALAMLRFSNDTPSPFPDHSNASSYEAPNFSIESPMSSLIDADCCTEGDSFFLCEALLFMVIFRFLFSLAYDLDMLERATDAFERLERDVLSCVCWISLTPFFCC